VLVEKVVLPYAQNLPGPQRLSLADGRQVCPAVLFTSERNAVNRLGEGRVAISGLTVGDDDLVRNATEFPGDAIDGSGEGVLIVGVRNDDQHFRRTTFRGSDGR